MIIVGDGKIQKKSFCFVFKNSNWLYNTTVDLLASFTDSHPTPEVVIWSGGRGQVGERNQESAEDVSHHVYSGGTACLYVLAHVPSHQIKRTLAGHWTWTWLTKAICTPFINTHVNTQRRESISILISLWQNCTDLFPCVRSKPGATAFYITAQNPSYLPFVLFHVKTLYLKWL